jgi:hypothetical protein
MSFVASGRHSGVAGRHDATSAVLTLSLTRGAVVVATWHLPVDGRIDLSVVDRLARLQLAARRLGYSVQLHQPSQSLCDVLLLVGLADVVGIAGELVVEVGGEPERREEVRVEERVEPGDPLA